MAGFSVGGLDELVVDIRKLSEMSSEDKISIVEAGAVVFQSKLKDVLDKLGLRDTGQLIDSIGIKMASSNEGAWAKVTAEGKRKKAYTGKRKGKHGHYTGDNSELLYIHEYGTPRMKASHPVETAINESNELVTQAMQEAFNNFLQKNNL